jgi:hypothetical protein
MECDMTRQKEEKGGRGFGCSFYAIIVNEPLVLTPFGFWKPFCPRAEVVPQSTCIVNVYDCPMFADVNVCVSCMLFITPFGASENTGVVTVNDDPPSTGTASTSIMKKIVVGFGVSEGPGFLIPKFHVSMKLFLESERRCFQLLCVSMGGAAVTQLLTVTEMVTECVIVPLVPVTTTVKLPVAEPVRVSIDVPDVVMLVGLSVAVKPVDGETVVVNATVPVNPLSGAMVIVSVAKLPGQVSVVTLVELAVIVKSGAVTWRVMTAVVWDSRPLVPVTVTVKSPLVAAIKDSVVLSNPPARLSVVVPRVAVRPADGAVVSETIPAKPLMLLAAISVEHVAPAVHGTVTGVEGEIAKSLKLSVSAAV